MPMPLDPLFARFTDKPHLLLYAVLGLISNAGAIMRRTFRTAGDINSWFYEFKARCSTNRLRYEKRQAKREHD